MPSEAEIEKKFWNASGYLSMSAKMLSEVYGHHHPDHMRSAADALGRKPLRGIYA
jgi:hypothetical protein